MKTELIYYLKQKSNEQKNTEAKPKEGGSHKMELQQGATIRTDPGSNSWWYLIELSDMSTATSQMWVCKQFYSLGKQQDGDWNRTSVWAGRWQNVWVARWWGLVWRLILEWWGRPLPRSLFQFQTRIAWRCYLFFTGDRFWWVLHQSLPSGLLRGPTGCVCVPLPRGIRGRPVPE